MPRQTVIGTFEFDPETSKQLAERFRWRMKHSEHTENAVEFNCKMMNGRIHLEFGFQSRRQLDWAQGYRQGLLDSQSMHLANVQKIVW